MIGHIPNPLSHAQSLNGPATAPGVNVVAYLAALRGVAILGEGDRLSTDDVNLRVFERWVLRVLGAEADMQMREGLIEQFQAEMRAGRFRTRRGKSYKNLASQVPAGIRRLHNRAFEAKHPVMVRPLVDRAALSRYRYVLTLTPQTQAALAWFEESGTRPGKNGAAGRLLKIASRQLGVEEAMWLMRRLGKNGLEQITPAMVTSLIPTTGPEDPAYRRVIRAINGLKAVYRSCVAAGRLPHDPTVGVGHNTFKEFQVRDFLPPEEMAKILDLSTLDRSDAAAVVDRLVMLLYLDTALRRNELASIALDQVARRDGAYTIHVLPENQKMSGKMAVDIPLLYPETNDLLAVYLGNLRAARAHGNSPALLLDRKGQPASGIALATACAREGAKLDLRTYHKKSPPRPHDLRRTFAMNNASPLGLNLQPHELAERLRDNIQTVFTHYVAANPLITAYRAKVYRKRTGCVVDADKVSDVLRTLQAWKVPVKLLGRLRREIDGLRAGGGEAQAAAVTDDGVWISEEQACAVLKARWGVVPHWRPFRKLMRNRSAWRRSERYGMVEYREEQIRALADGYLPASSLKRRAMINQARLAEVLCADRTLKIGRLVLLSREDAMVLITNNVDRDSGSTGSATYQSSAADRTNHPPLPRQSRKEEAA